MKNTDTATNLQNAYEVAKSHFLSQNIYKQVFLTAMGPTSATFRVEDGWTGKRTYFEVQF